MLFFLFSSYLFSAAAAVSSDFMCCAGTSSPSRLRLAVAAPPLVPLRDLATRTIKNKTTTPMLPRRSRSLFLLAAELLFPPRPPL